MMLIPDQTKNTALAEHYTSVGLLHQLHLDSLTSFANGCGDDTLAGIGNFRPKYIEMALVYCLLKKIRWILFALNSIFSVIKKSA